MTPAGRLKVISIGLDPTIALVDPSSGSRGDSMRRQEEYAGLAASYTAIVKTRRAPVYEPRRWGSGHAVLPTLSRTPLLFPWDAYRLAARIYRDGGADLVVTQDPFSTGLAGYWLKRQFGVPLCIQVHNDMIGCEWWLRESRANRLMAPLGAWLVRRADTVQAVSETIHARLVDRGVRPDRTWNIMTGSGIDCEQFRTADGATLRARIISDQHSALSHQQSAVSSQQSAIRTNDSSLITHDSSLITSSSTQRLVLFMGRLVKQKDLPTLLRAAALVAKEEPGTLFLLVGDGEEKGNLEALRRELRLEANVAILRGVGPGDAPSYYAACDLFVMSSLYEGKARALVEAACAGKPIVATAVSGADEVVVDGETGYLVPVRNPKALAGRILRVLRNPDMAREMGRRGQPLACERYDRKLNLQKMVQMWNATAKSRL